MKTSRYVFASVLALALVAIHPAFAEEYVILTPAAGSYYNTDFNQTAFYINSTLAPNATIVTFTSTLENASLISSIASKSPKYIYLVIQPANLSPNFLNRMDNLTKFLDGDPYVDAGWSVITGYDNTSAKNLFDNNMGSSWTSNYVFVPNNAGAQVAAGSRIASVFSASSAFGAGATNSTISGNLTTSGTDFVYFSGNSSGYNQLISGDNQSCPAADSLGAACVSAISVKNILFFADASESGKINGTNTDTTWLLQNSAANYSTSLPIAFSRITAAAPSNASAYIGPHSTRWVTSENIVKLFASSMSHGNDILSALRFAKNMLLFNENNETLTSNFTTFVESEYNLFGKAQKPSSPPATQTYSVNAGTRVHEPNQVMYSDNITNITWNTTATVSLPSAVAALYSSSGWQASGATAWYRYVSAVSAGKINMSILAAVAGEVKPDNSTIRIVSYSGSASLENQTAFNISVNETGTDHLANESVNDNPALRYDNDTDKIYFARIFSPNSSISGTLAQINITYITPGVRTNRTTIANVTGNNKVSEGFDAINPADAPVLNAILLYSLPYNITSSCYVSGSNCTLFDSGGVRYANISPVSTSSGTSSRTIQYNTTLDVNTTTTNTDYKYNRGETITVTTNVTAQNETVLDYNVRLVNSSGIAVWSNSTEDIYATSSVNTTQHNYTVPQNASNGAYTLKTYYLSNGTDFYASYETKAITITDSLNLTNATFASNEQDKLTKYYFRVNDSMTATGNVYNTHGAAISGAAVNISLIGTGVENYTSTTTGALGYYVAPFNWTSQPGSKVLQVITTYNNNTGRQNDTIYITRYMGNNLSVRLNKTKSNTENKTIYYYGESIGVLVNASDPSGLAVYKAQLSMAVTPAPAVPAANAETDTSGGATMTFTPTMTDNFTLNVSAKSPLNTSVTVYNDSQMVHIKWIKTYSYGSSTSFITSQSPSSAVVGTTETFNGNLTLSSGNESLISSTTLLSYTLRSGVGDDVTLTSDCTSSTSDKRFTISCKPKFAGDFNIVMAGKIVYDGVDILTNSTYYFTAITNTTTPSSGSTGNNQQTTSTQSSQNSTACTTNADCTSGDYCLSSKCTAISCANGVIVNHECVTSKKINIISYPPVVEIEQGKSGMTNFTIANNGYTSQTGIVFTLTLPTALAWKNWYSFNLTSSSLDAGKDQTLTVNITVPENTTIDQYSIKAKVTTKEGGSDEKTFVLQIAPSAKVRTNLTEALKGDGAAIKDLEDQMALLMKSAPEEKKNLTTKKMESIRALYSEANSAISAGKYFEAYTKEKELSQAISDLDVMLLDQKEALDAARSRRNLIGGIVLVISIVAGSIYYLWTPPGGGYQPGGGYKPSRKPTFTGLKQGVADIKEKIADAFSKFGKKKSSGKYDYLKSG